MKNTNQKGKITEIEILSKIMKLGYSVSIPFGDKDRYDQVWDINGKMLRIQVKTASPIDEEISAIKFKCTSVSNGKSHTYTKDEIDYFATYWDNQCYLIPVQECSVEKTLRFAPSKSGQIKGITFAKDYLLNIQLAIIKEEVAKNW